MISVTDLLEAVRVRSKGASGHARGPDFSTALIRASHYEERVKGHLSFPDTSYVVDSESPYPRQLGKRIPER